MTTITANPLLVQIRDLLLEIRDHCIQGIDLDGQAVDVRHGLSDDSGEGRLPSLATLGDSVARALAEGARKGRQVGVGVKLGHVGTSSSMGSTSETKSTAAPASGESANCICPRSLIHHPSCPRRTS